MELVSVASRTGRALQRYNLQGCRQVVGCIPYRFRSMEKSLLDPGTAKDQLEFLLISSQKSPKWMFPKGGWEIDESMEDAAVRETMEEAGVLGVVGNQLGCWTFKSKSQDKCHEGYMLSFMVTEELDIWPEKDVRSRIWVTANEAREKCVYPWMKEALDSFVGQVDDLHRKEEPFLGMEERIGDSSSLHFLKDGGPTCGATSRSGYEEEHEYRHFQLSQLQKKRESLWLRCLFQLFMAQEPTVNILAQCVTFQNSRSDGATLGHTTLSVNFQVSFSFDSKWLTQVNIRFISSLIKLSMWDKCTTACLFNFLMAKERIVVPNWGEDILVS